ncbi:glucosaminidase domain-containing protein [Bryobacter aggregatus]|uniref:glucosaminidase domain-containing protein n=1 Tax=Bryobacter aggregatus TaxID=360054 RepID=UPI0004E238F9|nr:glucosaminidase domain-containing protein [Bryobacter aggregatus]
MLAIVGIMAGPFVASSPAPSSNEAALKTDPRQVRLERFFEEKQCPVKKLAQEFVSAADRHNLDWRLLPSLAFIESGGGKAYHNNNIFGWNNGDHKFKSVRESIHTVAERLANSHHYRNKSLDKILVTYNPVPGYRDRVKDVMDGLGPAKATRPIQVAAQRNYYRN